MYLQSDCAHVVFSVHAPVGHLNLKHARFIEWPTHTAGYTRQVSQSISRSAARRFRWGAVTVRIVFLDHVLQNLHSHAVRADFHMILSVGIYRHWREVLVALVQVRPDLIESDRHSYLYR